MADANKCGVCGEYYDVSHGVYRAYILGDPVVLYLCPECVRKMREWLVKQEENNERNNK